MTFCNKTSLKNPTQSFHFVLYWNKMTGKALYGARIPSFCGSEFDHRWNFCQTLLRRLVIPTCGFQDHKCKMTHTHTTTRWVLSSGYILGDNEEHSRKLEKDKLRANRKCRKQVTHTIRTNTLKCSSKFTKLEINRDSIFG